MMEDSLWRSPDDPALAAAIARVWNFAERVTPLRFPPGIHKHRSIDDAQRLREQWQEANFRSFWERRNAVVSKPTAEVSEAGDQPST
jgi:hypothetical protein